MTEACGAVNCELVRVEYESRIVAKKERDCDDAVKEGMRDLEMWGYIRPSTKAQMLAVGIGAIEGILIGAPIALVIRVAAGWM